MTSGIETKTNGANSNDFFIVLDLADDIPSENEICSWFMEILESNKECLEISCGKEGDGPSQVELLARIHPTNRKRIFICFRIVRDMENVYMSFDGEIYNYTIEEDGFIKQGQLCYTNADGIEFAITHPMPNSTPSAFYPLLRSVTVSGVTQDMLEDIMDAIYGKWGCSYDIHSKTCRVGEEFNFNWENVPRTANPRLDKIWCTITGDTKKSK